MKRNVLKVLSLTLLILTLSVSLTYAAPKTTILRDNYGVPHIFANTLDGLYSGFGYAIAQDRLYQLEMFKRTYWGRLSEVYGEGLLAFDQGNRRDGFTVKEMQKQISNNLKPYHKIAIKAFAAGINRYIKEALADKANKLPKEFHDFGIDPEEWTDADVAANFLSVMGLFMDGSAELQNASMLQYLTERYGAKQAAAFFQRLGLGNRPLKSDHHGFANHGVT